MARTGRVIVGICGPMGAGKTTFATELVNRHKFIRLRMAGPLKNMLRVIGCTTEMLDGAEKNITSDLLNGRTPRYAMQTLGTEWARKCMGEGFWVNLMRHKLLHEVTDQNVVIDDIRYENEVGMLYELGGFTVLMEGNPLNIDRSQHNHASEVLPIEEGDADFYVRNNKDINYLTTQAERLMRYLKGE